MKKSLIYRTILQPEITHGILRALQKPGKPKGLTSNLHPIILLSVLKKILATCIIKTIHSRLDSTIAISQAEHVLATKLIIERTISSTDENVYLLLQDINKALDSVLRNTLIEELKNVLNQDEQDLIRIMLDVKILKPNKYKSWFFGRGTRAPYEDGADDSEFTFHLAKSLETTIANDTPSLEELYNILSNCPIVSPNYQIDIDQQYADDISKMSTSISAIEKMKDDLPSKLAQRKLKINESKTEEYTVKRANCDNRLRDCK